MTRFDPGDERPDVVLLPGFVGMNMDDATGRRIWLDPLPIATGELASLFALDARGADDADPRLGVHPEGPIGFVYGRAIDALIEAGLAVHVFPLDFRRSVLDTAAELARFMQALAAERRGRRFIFFGHSMGAILATLYPYYDAAWESRIAAAIHVGGTLAGTFEPVEGLTGSHWFLEVVGTGDRDRELAIRRSMSTWPGIFDMLPDPLSFPDAVDVYKAASWPEAVRPPQAWLDRVRDEVRPRVRESPLSRVPTYQLLSVDSPTVTSLAWTSEGLAAGPMIHAGDGTVAARTAHAGVSRALRVDFPHTFMPNDPGAIRAVIELARGASPSLPEITAEMMSQEIPFPLPPPVSMAKTLLHAVTQRALTGQLRLDDLLWPFRR
ncbi:MAG: hypothetical protein U0359_32245 [Byssovorax sp.]